MISAMLVLCAGVLKFYHPFVDEVPDKMVPELAWAFDAIDTDKPVCLNR